MRCCVVGAGLGGSLMAVYLARSGRRVDLFERRPDPRGAALAGGRSINLALSTRGIHALSQVGLAEPVLRDSVPMRGRLIHSVRGRLSFQPYGTEEDQVIHSVSRDALNRHLVEAADGLPGVECFFGHECQGVDPATATLEFTTSDGRTKTVEGGLIVAADGAFSAIRGSLRKQGRLQAEKLPLSHAYKELTIPPLAGGGFRMDPNALHIWPRGGFMMIALPNADGSFTCTLFAPFEGPQSFASLGSDAEVADYFRKHFADAFSLMTTLLEDFRVNPTSSLVTVRCEPWDHCGRVVLIGDAAHAVVPFYGQGMNASFEDCFLLSRALDEQPGQAAALTCFSTHRKEHADALADLAVSNFLEMRDRVSSPLFLVRKSLERALHRGLPNLFLPLYTMVTFSRLPYADAIRRWQRQTRLIRATAAGLALLMLLGVLTMWGSWR